MNSRNTWSIKSIKLNDIFGKFVNSFDRFTQNYTLHSFNDSARCRLDLTLFSHCCLLLDLIPEAETYIMKIDIQGFECRVSFV